MPCSRRSRSASASCGRPRRGSTERDGRPRMRSSARLRIQDESQTAREAELKRREKDAERAGRRAGQALPDGGAAPRRGGARRPRARRPMRRPPVRRGDWSRRGFASRASGSRRKRSARLARRGSGSDADRGRGDAQGTAGQPAAPGEVLEVRSDGKVVVAVGAMRIVPGSRDAHGASAPPKRGGRKARTPRRPGRLRRRRRRSASRSTSAA